VDPIRYKLLFERPEPRAGEHPDIDCDFCKTAEEVIAYVQRTYGTRTSPAHQFGRGSPGRVRDVGRVSRCLRRGRRIAKMIPADVKRREDALKAEPRFRK